MVLGKIRQNVLMSQYTSFGIGGPADYFIEVKNFEELNKAINFAKNKKLPFFILGSGSNILINDKGIRGIVIKNSLKGIIRKKNNVIVQSGETLENLLSFCIKAGLSNLEFAAGIPGTLGGAIYGNAGAYGKSIGDFLVKAKIFDKEGNIREVDKDYFQFSYRNSFLKRKKCAIFLEGEFALKQGNSFEITREINDIISQRKKKHPGKELGCAGSYFKNIAPDKSGQRRKAAGIFLENIGAKSLRKGNACIYDKHANFIVNPGGAKASEVLQLAKELKEKVFKTYGILLEEEVVYIDEQLGKFQ